MRALLKKKSAPLMKIEVLHSLKGRLRIKTRALKYLYDVKEELISSLESVDAVKQCEFSSVTGSMLVYYHTDRTNQDDILEILETGIGVFSLIAHKNEREAKSHLTVQERRIQQESVSSFMNRVAVTGASLVILALKGYGRYEQTTLYRRLTNPASLMSLALSTSIFKSGVESLKVNKRPNADTLTMTAILTAILTGRSMSALMTILLSDIAELMTAYTMEQTREAISDMIGTGDEEVTLVHDDGTLEVIDIDDVQVEDIISVQTGEKN